MSKNSSTDPSNMVKITGLKGGKLMFVVIVDLKKTSPS
jgi:hypothetical protein